MASMSAESPSVTLPIRDSRDTQAKRLTYRVDNVPAGTTEKELLRKFHSNDKKHIEFKSLAPAWNNHDGSGLLTATILFNEPGREPQIDDDDADDITVDSNFQGFTPLNPVEGGAPVADIIAVPGLAGHAFGSWAATSSTMWLRDYLPKALKLRARILMYGYQSQIHGPSAGNNSLRTFGKKFWNRLMLMRQDPACMNRPLILIGHSLGGLIIKQCIVDEDPIALSRHLIRGLFFFGTPHGGLNVEALRNVVEGEPSKNLIDEVAPGSPTLEYLTEKFIARMSQATMCDIYTYFENLRTHTVVLSKDGLYVREGPLQYMVDPMSARLNLPREKCLSVDADHRTIAKLKNDQDGVFHDVVLHMKDCLKSGVEMHDAMRQAGTLEPNMGMSPSLEQNRPYHHSPGLDSPHFSSVVPERYHPEEYRAQQSSNGAGHMQAPDTSPNFVPQYALYRSGSGLPDTPFDYRPSPPISPESSGQTSPGWQQPYYNQSASSPRPSDPRLAHASESVDPQFYQQPQQYIRQGNLPSPPLYGQSVGLRRAPTSSQSDMDQQGLGLSALPVSYPAAPSPAIALASPPRGIGDGCDRCRAFISESHTYYHCPSCEDANGNTYDMCQNCEERFGTCERGHDLIKKRPTVQASQLAQVAYPASTFPPLPTNSNSPAHSGTNHSEVDQDSTGTSQRHSLISGDGSFAVERPVHATDTASPTVSAHMVSEKCSPQSRYVSPSPVEYQQPPVRASISSSSTRVTSAFSSQDNRQNDDSVSVSSVSTTTRIRSINERPSVGDGLVIEGSGHFSRNILAEKFTCGSCGKVNDWIRNLEYVCTCCSMGAIHKACFKAGDHDPTHPCLPVSKATSRYYQPFGVVSTPWQQQLRRRAWTPDFEYYHGYGYSDMPWFCLGSQPDCIRLFVDNFPGRGTIRLLLGIRFCVNPKNDVRSVHGDYSDATMAIGMGHVHAKNKFLDTPITTTDPGQLYESLLSSFVSKSMSPRMKQGDEQYRSVWLQYFSFGDQEFIFTKDGLLGVVVSWSGKPTTGDSEVGASEAPVLMAAIEDVIICSVKPGTRAIARKDSIR